MAETQSIEASAENLQARLAELGVLSEAWTREAVASAGEPPAERFGGMLEYHLGWRDTSLATLDTAAPAGKKLRSALTLLVSEAVCGSIEPARAAAVAVELVHNFSLVHDDIQDGSRLRRYRPTVWSLWGVAQGINVGDGLFALAQLVLLRQPDARARAMAAVLNSECLRLVEGQYLDLELQRGSLPATLDTYEAMIARKTGALFSCAARLGAIAADADERQQEALAAYGQDLGIAFQEQDDVLGVWGSSEETGKPEAADVADRKKGLPSVLALARPDAPEWLRTCYEGGARRMPKAQVRRVIRLFDHLGVREEAVSRVAGRYRAALDALNAANTQEPARSHLVALCELLLTRNT